jgi:hypothetical protein
MFPLYLACIDQGNVAFFYLSCGLLYLKIFPAKGWWGLLVSSRVLRVYKFTFAYFIAAVILFNFVINSKVSYNFYVDLL